MTQRIVILDGATLNPGDLSVPVDQQLAFSQSPGSDAGIDLQERSRAWSQLAEFGEFQLFDRTSENELVSRLSDAEIAVTNKVALSAQTIEQLPNLKFIAVTATGYDCVDVQAAARRGIPVSNVPTYGTDSVAQFTFALLLELCHQVGRHDAAVRAGDWQRSTSFCFWKTPQIELVGKTLGIIGFGRIGRRVGQLGNAFGMRVLACSHGTRSSAAESWFEWADLQRVARESDVLSLHCGLTPETRGLINAEFLSRMKPGACLINTSRGALVDEPALADALNSGRLAAAAVDVVSAEPMRSGNPLLQAKNCLITPHIAWSTQAARRRMLQTTFDNVRAFAAGSPINVVNFPAANLVQK